MDDDNYQLSGRNLKALIESNDPENLKPPEKKKTSELIKESFTRKI